MRSRHGPLGDRAPKLIRRFTRTALAVAACSALMATPAGAASNGLLAFETSIGGQTINTVDPVPTDSATRLTTGPLAVPGIPDRAGSANAAWSADGTKLAYSSRAGGKTDIYEVNANAAVDGGSTTPRRLTSDPVAAIDPTWSPDGDEIAFTSLRNGSADIYTVNRTTLALRRLTTDPGADEQPDWSPDGSQIAFQSDRTGSQDVWVMARDGSGQRDVTSAPGEESDADFNFDGTQLAFSAGSPGASGREIYAIAPAGGPATRLTRFAAGFRNAFPAWSPDGKEIAFSMGSQIAVMPAAGTSDTTGPRIVAFDGTDPSWAILPVPEGKVKGDVEVKGPKDASTTPVSSGDSVELKTGTVIDTSGGGMLTLSVNRQAVPESTPDSTAVVTYAVVSVTDRTPEALDLRIRRPDCAAAEVLAAKSKSKKKARVRTTTKGKPGHKKSQVKPSSPEGHMSTRNTDYEVVVTCNGTYVKVYEGVVRVDRNAPYRTVNVRAGGRLFIPKGH